MTRDGCALAIATLALMVACGDLVTPDTKAPSVSVTLSPCCLVSIPGTQVTVTANADDDVGVQHVEFYARSPSQQAPVKFADDSTPPFTATYPPAGFVNGDDGAYAISVKAYDAAGNVGSDAIALTVAMDVTAPTVTLTVPAGRITSRIGLPVTVNASEALSRVEVYDGTTLVASASEPNLPKQLFVNITAAHNGSRILTARGWDRAQNVAESPPDTAVVDIRWSWDSTLPVVSAKTTAVVANGAAGVYATGDRLFAGDAFLVKLDAGGALIWQRTFADAGARVAGRATAIDGSGGVYVAMGRDGTGSADDCLIVKYDADGGQQWTRVIDSGNAEQNCLVATDGSDAIYAAGTTMGSFDSGAVGGTPSGSWRATIATAIAHGCGNSRRWTMGTTGLRALPSRRRERCT